MIKFIFALAAACVSMICNAQVSHDRPVTDFTKIAVSNGIRVMFTEAPANSLKVEADSNEHLKMIKTEVSSGVLKIYIDGNSKIRNFKNLSVFVAGKKVNEFSSDSGSAIICKGQISQQSVAIEVSSGSRFEGDIESKTVAVDANSGALAKLTIGTSNLSLKANSGANVTLSGKATSAAVKTDSGSLVNAKSLETENATIKASSGASVSVSVSDSVTINADSSSSVHYFGTPKNETFNKNSMASIRKN